MLNKLITLNKPNIFNKHITRALFVLLSCAVFATGAQAEEEDGLSERIDFGNSYIMGQTIKSGAVYLTHRKKSKIESMLKMRVHYQEEILQDFEVGEPVVIDDEKAK